MFTRRFVTINNTLSMFQRLSFSTVCTVARCNLFPCFVCMLLTVLFTGCQGSTVTFRSGFRIEFRVFPYHMYVVNLKTSPPWSILQYLCAGFTLVHVIHFNMFTHVFMWYDLFSSLYAVYKDVRLKIEKHLASSDGEAPTLRATVGI